MTWRPFDDQPETVMRKALGGPTGPVYHHAFVPAPPAEMLVAAETFQHLWTAMMELLLADAADMVDVDPSDVLT